MEIILNATSRLCARRRLSVILIIFRGFRRLTLNRFLLIFASETARENGQTLLIAK